MRRQLALIPLLLLLPLAGCSGRTDDATAGAAPAETTTTPTVAAASAPTPVTEPSNKPTPTTTKVSNASRAIPSGSRDPGWGTQYAFLKSSKLAKRQITYDLVEWYDGKQAVKACAEDGVKPAENDYCVGWYIRNNNKKLRTLTVDPDAWIRVMIAGEMKSVTLETFLSEVDNGNLMRFDIDANRIIKLDHVYLP
jgi:hypothetical protein